MFSPSLQSTQIDKSPNRLTDAAAPIIVKGVHMANVFVGPFFLMQKSLWRLWPVEPVRTAVDAGADGVVAPATRPERISLVALLQSARRLSYR